MIERSILEHGNDHSQDEDEEERLEELYQEAKEICGATSEDLLELMTANTEDLTIASLDFEFRSESSNDDEQRTRSSSSGFSKTSVDGSSMSKCHRIIEMSPSLRSLTKSSSNISSKSGKDHSKNTRNYNDILIEASMPTKTKIKSSRRKKKNIKRQQKHHKAGSNDGQIPLSKFCRDLEKKINDMKYAAVVAEVELNDRSKIIHKLEKENTELKEELGKFRCMVGRIPMREQQYEERNTYRHSKNAARDNKTSQSTDTTIQNNSNNNKYFNNNNDHDEIDMFQKLDLDLNNDGKPQKLKKWSIATCFRRLNALPFRTKKYDSWELN